MKTQNGFTLMNKNEIGSYLAKQKVTRKITRLQVHHITADDHQAIIDKLEKVVNNLPFERTLNTT